MSHTALVHSGLFFGITGRLIPTASACTSGSQAIGFADETIRLNRADGMVAGEGGAALVLAEAGRAHARGARVLAELVGFATNSDGNHITQPQARTMQMVLDDAGRAPAAIGFVSGCCRSIT